MQPRHVLRGRDASLSELGDMLDSVRGGAAGAVIGLDADTGFAARCLGATPPPKNR